MAQAPGNGLFDWSSYPGDFPGNGGHDQFDDLILDPNLDPNLHQFSLPDTNPQSGHGYPGYDGQGGSRPTSTQPYTNAAFAYPQSTNPSLGQGQPLSPNAQYITPAGGRPTQPQSTHDFVAHQYSSSIDHGSAFAASNGFPTGGAQPYQDNPYESQYIQHQGFTNGNALAPQQHDEYAPAPSHFVNDTMPNNLHPGHIEPVWNRPESTNQYSSGTMQNSHRDDSPFGQATPYPGHRGPGPMPLTPNPEPHSTPTPSGHAHFPIPPQRETADVRTTQPQWQSPQKPFASQQPTTYIQQSPPGGINQGANHPQSGRGTPLQQQNTAPFSGHYSPAPANTLLQLPPQSASPSPAYVQQQQQQQKQVNVAAVARPSKPHPANRVGTQQVVQPASTPAPASQDGGFIRSVPTPLPVPPRQIPNLPLPRVLPDFTSAAVQSENAKTTGSLFVAFEKRTISAANVPKHIRPFNPVAVDPDKKLGMCFPQKRLLPCELIYQYQQAPTEERRALEKQLKDLLGDPLPAQYRSIIKGSIKGSEKPTTANEDQDNQDSEEIVQSDTRPEDPNEAAAWDALQIVDLDRVTSAEAINTRVGVAIAHLGDLVRRLMVPVKSASDELDKARKAKKDSSEINRLKSEVISKTPPLYRAIDAAEDKGDSQVLANLGGNQRLVVDLTSALRVGNNIGDHNGDFARAVLRLMSHSKTITNELLGKTNWPKVKEKFLEKGDEEVRELIQAIADNAAARSALNKEKQPAAEGIKASSASSQTKQPSTTVAKKMGPADLVKKKPSSATRVSSEPASAKRPRDEEPDSRNVKKLAAEPPTTSSAQGTIKPPTSKSASTANPAPSSQGKIWSGSALLPGKSKPVAKPAPKPVLTKGDATKPDMAKLPSFKKSDPAKIKKPDLSRSDASQSSSSKLGALLEEISKPKAAKAAQSVATPDSGNETPETPEEKQRRLRREQRRKLRVSWKEGDELTQVRIFHKDIGEDEGRAGNMIRDARDDRSEGMVLKQGMKLDEDEEEEIPYRPWFEPLGVSFATIPEDKREDSFLNRGGNKAIRTPQQDYIAERENRELMVIYTDPADIPPTPKSPPPPSQQDRDNAASAGVSVVNSVADHQEIQRRWNETAHMGLSWALYNAVRRVEEQKASHGQQSSGSDIDATALLNNLGSMAQQNSQGSAQQLSRSAVPDPHATAASRDAQVYALLTSDKLKQWVDPDPYNPTYPKTHRRNDYATPEVQKAADAVEAVVEQLRGKSFPPTEPPAWLTGDQTRIDEWYYGFNKDRQRAHEEQSRTQNAPAQLSQPQGTAPASMANNQGDMAAILAYYAQFNQPQNQATNQQQDAWAQYYQSMYQQAQPVQQPPAGQISADQTQLQALLSALGSGQQGAPAPAAANADPQLQALLAGLATSPQVSQPYQNAQAASVPNPNDPNYAAYMTAMAQWAAGQPQSNNNAQAVSAPGYDQQRQQKPQTAGSRSTSGSHAGAKSSTSNNNTIPPHLRGINRDKIGTKPCVFWANGTCNKGDKCTFRHD